MLLSAITLAGCSGFGGSKKDQTPAVDANIYPANYRAQVATLLATQLADRADFHGALIAPPVLKPVGDNPHYIVCVQFNGRGLIRNKVAIYLAGEITQLITATPEQCSDAAFQPFKELEAETPSSSLFGNKGDYGLMPR
jgi:hypothetical protein